MSEPLYLAAYGVFFIRFIIAHRIHARSYKNNSAYEGAYTASGYGGQFITVIPKLDLVIAHKTKLDLLTLGGIRYRNVGDMQYWEIMDQVVKASDR